MILDLSVISKNGKSPHAQVPHQIVIRPETEVEHETIYNRLVHAREAGVLDFTWEYELRRFTIFFPPKNPPSKE